jgi:hypothetical protein
MISFRAKPIIFFLNLIFSFCLFSCKNELKVSVFEPLPSEVIKSYTIQDSTFLEDYEFIRLLADSVFVSKSASPQFAALDYSTLFEFVNIRKTEFEKLKDSKEFNEKWLNLFGNDIEKFESDSLKYLNYILENDFHNFIEIEVQRVSKKTAWVNSYTSVDLIFKPKNNTGIRKIQGYVYFLPKSEKFDSLDFSAAAVGKSAYFSFSGFSKGVFRDFALDTQRNLYDLEDLSGDLIKQKFNIHFMVHELVIDDRFIDTDFEEVPTIMKEVLRGKYSFYKDLYIKDNINSDFKDIMQFNFDSANRIAKVKYPLAAQFLETGNQKYSEIQDAQLKKESEERRKNLGLD